MNEAVKNNPEKFPEGYIIPLQQSEIQQLAENSDRFKTMKHLLMRQMRAIEK